MSMSFPDQINRIDGYGTSLLRKIWRRLTGRKKTRVLVIRHDGIGDWVLWFSTAKHIRELFPADHYEIVLMGSYVTDPLNRISPYWDACTVRSFKSRLRAALNIPKKLMTLFSADVLINPVPNQSALGIARFCPASVKVCFKFRGAPLVPIEKKQIDRFLSYYTHHVEVDLSRHILNINAAMLSFLGGKIEEPRLADLTCFPMQRFPYEDYILLAPGAEDVRRRWSAEKMSALADKLLERFQFKKLLICGASSDIAFVERCTELLRNKDSIVNLCGKTNLTELFSLIRFASLVLCNDSGISHIAAAYSVPSACVFGGGHFGYYHPYPEAVRQPSHSHAIYKKMPCFGCNWQCSIEPEGKSSYPCIDAVSVDAVFEEVLELVKEGKERSVL